MLYKYLLCSNLIFIWLTTRSLRIAIEGAQSVYGLSSIAACSNGIDDDADGTEDAADPGCANTSDIDERSPTLPCDNGVDDDGDGRKDFDPRPGGSAFCGRRRRPGLLRFARRTEKPEVPERTQRRRNDRHRLRRRACRFSARAMATRLAPIPSARTSRGATARIPTGGAASASRSRWCCSRSSRWRPANPSARFRVRMARASPAQRRRAWGSRAAFLARSDQHHSVRQGRNEAGTSTHGRRWTPLVPM